MEIVAGAAEAEVDARAAGGEEVAVDFVAELEGEAEEVGSGRWQCGGWGLEIHWCCW